MCDTSREIRSILMVLFPCPPLPMIGGRIDGSPAIFSSHDLLAKLIDEVAQRNDQRSNEKRKEMQESLTRAYLRFLEEKDEEEHWEVMCNFTRLYMNSYFPGAIRDVRIVEQGSTPLHIEQRVREWMAAREIVGGNSEASSKHYEKLTGPPLYRTARKVILKFPSLFNEAEI